MKTYLALIGDLRASREIEDRKKAQKRLETAIKRLNKTYGHNMVSPLTVTLGDEFQALFNDASELWKLIFGLEARIAPLQVRFGIGIGELTTRVNRQAAVGMDGPAFHKARDAIVALKASEGCYYLKGLGLDDTLVNSIFSIISDQRKRWNENRLNIFLDLLAEKKADQIAARLNISKQAVYKNIDHGSLTAIATVFSEVAGRINQSLK